MLTLIMMSLDTSAYDVGNIRAFLKKQKNCSFAVYKVMRGRAIREQFPQRFDVTCVGNIVTGENTINEKRGCGLFNYNVETGRMTFLTHSGPNMIVGEDCESGGFEKLINSYLYGHDTEMEKRGVTLDKTLVRSTLDQYPDSTAPTSFFRLVVYSEKDSYKKALGYPIEDIELSSVDVKPTTAKGEAHGSQRENRKSPELVKPQPTKMGLLGNFGKGGVQKDPSRAYDGSGELIGMADAATGVAGLGTKGRGVGATGYGTGGIGTKGSVQINVGGQEADFSDSMDREAIRRVFREHLREIRNCYEREMRRSPDRYGEIVLEWEIDDGGRVARCIVKNNDLGNDAVGDCIVTRLKAWRFPNGQTGRVIYPLGFSSQK